jgi:hypothetical protein
MLTCCGEFVAPAAVMVTIPLCKIPLTVTVSRDPAETVPVPGEMLYPLTVADELQDSCPPPRLATVNDTVPLTGGTQARLEKLVGETDSAGGTGMAVAVATGELVGVAPVGVDGPPDGGDGAGCPGASVEVDVVDPAAVDEFGGAVEVPLAPEPPLEEELALALEEVKNERARFCDRAKIPAPASRSATARISVTTHQAGIPSRPVSLLRRRFSL